METFNHNYNTRSQNNQDTVPIELNRAESCEPHSPNHGLSPVICSEIDDSKDDTAVSVDMSCSELSDCLVASPSQDVTSPPFPKDSNELPKSAEGVDSDLFYAHLAKYPNIIYKDIQCNESGCGMNMKSCGIEYGIYRFIFCELCEQYICSRCRFPGRHVSSLNSNSDINESFNHSSTCGNPSYFVT